MNPWELLDSCSVSGEGGEMRLYRRDQEYSIRTGNQELMNSRVHGSEEALAELACKRVNTRPQPRILIGGLGMGYTLAAALNNLGATAEVVIAELVPAVIKWNQTLLGPLAGTPLNDKRVTLFEGDVGKLIRSQKNNYDAILLDVDNGPEGLTRKENNSLYSPAGLSAAAAALRPGGIFAVWSITPDSAFTKKLQRAGFNVEEIRARARGNRGARHMIWLGSKR